MKSCTNCVDGAVAFDSVFKLCMSCRAKARAASALHRKRHHKEVLEQKRAHRKNNVEHYRKLEREWSRRNPKRVKNTYLKSRYGIDIEQWSKLFESQEGRCAVCKDRGKLCVDHNHMTGAVRELLCPRCNAAIGMLRESPKLCDAAKKYLKKHS